MVDLELALAIVKEAGCTLRVTAELRPEVDVLASKVEALEIKSAATDDALAQTAMVLAESAGEAADALAAKEAEIARLREALKNIAHAVRLGSDYDVLALLSLATACQNEARAALTEKDA